MKALHDQQMEELSDLFGRGKLSNAQQIASLLKVELDSQGDKQDEEIEQTKGVKSLLDLLRRITHLH